MKSPIRKVEEGRKIETNGTETDRTGKSFQYNMIHRPGAGGSLSKTVGEQNSLVNASSQESHPERKGRRLLEPYACWKKKVTTSVQRNLPAYTDWPPPHQELARRGMGRLKTREKEITSRGLIGL